MVQVPGTQNWPALPVTCSLHLIFWFPSYFPIKAFKPFGDRALSVIHMYIIPKFKPNDVRKGYCEEGVYVVQHKCIQSKKSFFTQPNDVGLHFAVKLGSLVWACHLGFQDWNGLMQWVYELCLLSLPSLWWLCFHVVLRSLENWCMIQTRTRNSLSHLMKSDILTRYFHSSVIHEAEV